ncbi:MAG: hypothetical protein COB77_04900 [Gammaproteobacteria bacterium]|nr:MAG: hypothetical protein COB77_04900 [Gammaproteobacteria bacterium]
MKITFLSILVTLLISTPVMAEKPSWAGAGKPTAEQKEAHQSITHKKEKIEADYKDAEEKIKSAKKSNKEKDLDNDEDEGKNIVKDKAEKKEAKDLDKQKNMKSEQVQKELDKGSEKGQDARETHSKKWWKLW